MSASADIRAGARRHRLTLPRLNWLGLILILAVALGVEFLLGLHGTKLDYAAKPSAILIAGWHLLTSGSLVRDTLHTLTTTLIGWASASLAGVLFGLWIGLSPLARRFSLASIEVLRSLPGITFVPVAILLFGFTRQMEIITIFFVCVWPVLISALAGAQAVALLHRDVAKTLHLSQLAVVTKITLPSAMPFIIAGMKLALSTGLAIAVVTEMIGNPAGLGYAIVQFQGALQPASMFAVIIWIGMLGLLLNVCFDSVASRFPLVEMANDQNVRTGISLWGLLPLAIALAGWQLLQTGQSPFFPKPSLWVHAIVNESILPALWATVKSFFIALLVATFFGSVLGMVIGRNKSVSRAVGPLFEFFRSLPAAAIVPVAVLIGGYTESMKVVVVVFAAIWPILISVQDGARRLPLARTELSRSLRMSFWQGVSKILLPSMLPFILLGVRIAAPIVLIIVLLVEIITQVPGLGALLAAGQQSYQTALVYGVVVIAGCLGLITSLLVSAVEAVLGRAKES